MDQRTIVTVIVCIMAAHPIAGHGSFVANEPVHQSFSGTIFDMAEQGMKTNDVMQEMGLSKKKTDDDGSRPPIDRPRVHKRQAGNPPSNADPGNDVNTVSDKFPNDASLDKKSQIVVNKNAESNVSMETTPTSTVLPSTTSSSGSENVSTQASTESSSTTAQTSTTVSSDIMTSTVSSVTSDITTPSTEATTEATTTAATTENPTTETTTRIKTTTSKSASKKSPLCPPVRVGSRLLCLVQIRYQCTNDVDCISPMKCCPGTCGNVCRRISKGRSLLLSVMS